MKKNELILNDENIIRTLKNDVLKRLPLMFKLIKLLNTLNNNYTISIDGDWGVGKTFFIKQLLFLCFNEGGINYVSNKDDIENVKIFKEKYIPIYYNAWENDDHDNVIESLIYSILDVYPKYKKDISNKKQDFDKIVKPFLINIIEKGTLGFISKDTLDNIQSFEDLSASIITKEEQKNGLYEIFNLLTKNDTRILLIIDELDRCKPDYAVKVLETIKHFYNYRNITSLVVTNNRQLSECIKHFYGENFDAYTYLNKMYDTVLSLDINDLDDYLSQYLDFPNDSYLSKEISYLLVKYLNFSLRECNSFVSMYDISIKYINLTRGFDHEAYLAYSNIFLPIGLALKIKNIDEYNKFIKGNSDKFLDNFIKYVQKTDKKDKYISWFSRIFNVKEGENLETTFIESYHNVINQPKYGIDKYPLLEALSLLGNLVSYDEEDIES